MNAKTIDLVAFVLSLVFRIKCIEHLIAKHLNRFKTSIKSFPDSLFEVMLFITDKKTKIHINF